MKEKKNIPLAELIKMSKNKVNKWH